MAGVFAELTDVHDLARACEAVRARGYTRFEAYTPGLAAELGEPEGARSSAGARFALVGGIAAGTAGALCLRFEGIGAWISTASLALLGAAAGAVAGLWWAHGLGRLRHPLLASERFLTARETRFVLYIDARDPLFDREGTVAILESLGATAVERAGD